jgi:cobalt/nickel transport system ATP-binding protein
VFSPTVREEVAFGPLQLGLDQDTVHARVRDVLEMLAIGRLADRAPHQLSGGERKRVALAAVLATNPEVLLFDEPTAGLDPRSQTWLLELIEELHRAGKTIVCATHDLHALEWVADRCVVFSEAHRIVLDGPPEAILADSERLVALNLVHEHPHRHAAARVALAGGRTPARSADVPARAA